MSVYREEDDYCPQNRHDQQCQPQQLVWLQMRIPEEQIHFRALRPVVAASAVIVSPQPSRVLSIAESIWEVPASPDETRHSHTSVLLVRTRFLHRDNQVRSLDIPANVFRPTPTS